MSNESGAHKPTRTKLIIVSSPSGGGKNSFVERACREEPRLVDVVTYTTRPMRRGEVEGNPYHFVTRERFQELIRQDFFVEHAQVHENFYGTPYSGLDAVWTEGKCVIMDIDVQGAETFRRKFPDSKSVFILPPSIDELRRRVIRRDGKVPEDIEVRMANAEKEVARAHEFDFQVVNDIFETSFAEFKKIVAELL